MLSKILSWTALALSVVFAGLSLAGIFGGAALGGLGPTLILAAAGVALPKRTTIDSRKVDRERRVPIFMEWTRAGTCRTHIQAQRSPHPVGIQTPDELSDVVVHLRSPGSPALRMYAIRLS